MSRKNKGLRTCLYSNNQYPRQELIRFVKVDGKLTLDKEQNMPGRGYWLKPTTQALNDPKLLNILSKRTKCSVDPDILKEIRIYEKAK